MNIKILHENCDYSLSLDRGLPYTAYVVTYVNEESVCYDIVITEKKSDIFDHYWDKYREGLKSFKQSEGRVNPRMWDYKPRPESKKRR